MKSSLVLGGALVLLCASSAVDVASAADGGTDGGNGAVTIRADGGDPEPVEMPADEGCAMVRASSASGSPAAIGLALFVAAAFVSRRRR